MNLLNGLAVSDTGSNIKSTDTESICLNDVYNVFDRSDPGEGRDLQLRVAG